MTLFLQAIRHENLAHLIEQLRAEGVKEERQILQLLGGLGGAELGALMRGAPISDALAREIEWSMHRPVHWMDTAHDRLSAG